MKLFSQFFVVLYTVVVGTVSIAAEPCENGYGKYDMVTCNACAENGPGAGRVNQGQCCEAIFLHSLGHEDDGGYFDDEYTLYRCAEIHDACDVPPFSATACYPGLICVDKLCQLNANDPNAHAAASLVTSSSTGNTIDPFVVVVVGLLGAAMTMLYNSRHRGLLRRHHYSEVDAPRMDV